MRNLIPQHLYEMSKLNDNKSFENLFNFLFYIKHNTVSDFRKLREKLNMIKPGGYVTQGKLIEIFNTYKKQKFIDDLIEWLNGRDSEYTIIDIFQYSINTNEYFTIEIRFSVEDFVISYWEKGKSHLHRRYSVHALDNLDKLWNSIYNGAINYIENI